MQQRDWAAALGKLPEDNVNEPQAEELFLPPAPPEPQWDEVWSLLTEPRQMGLGEGLATEAWAPETPEQQPERHHREKDPYQWQRSLVGKMRDFVEEKTEQIEEKLDEYAKKLEQKAEAALPARRRTPAVRYDGRYQQYFEQVATARAKAKNALIDPYTDIVSEFGTPSQTQASWEKPKTKLYAHAAGANLQLGRMSVRNWSLRTAESYFKQALKADAHDPDAWWHLGVVKLFRRKNKDAARAFQNASDYRPGNARNRICLGIAQYHDGRYDTAEETFRYEKSMSGPGVGALSFLVCSLRMQGKWDAARMQIQSLAGHPLPAWKETAAQCARCVNRGEGIQASEQKSQRIWSAVKIIGLLGAVLTWALLNLGEIIRLVKNLQDFDWKSVIVPAIFLLVALVEYIKRSAKQRDRKELYGDGKEDIPCWQTRSWMRPHRLDVFGQPMEIPRR